MRARRARSNRANTCELARNVIDIDKVKRSGVPAQDHVLISGVSADSRISLHILGMSKRGRRRSATAASPTRYCPSPQDAPGPD